MKKIVLLILIFLLLSVVIIYSDGDISKSNVVDAESLNDFPQARAAENKISKGNPVLECNDYIDGYIKVSNPNQHNFEKLWNKVLMHKEYAFIGPYGTPEMPHAPNKELNKIIRKSLQEREYRALIQEIIHSDRKQINNTMYGANSILAAILSHDPNISEKDLTRIIAAGLEPNLNTLIVATAAGVSPPNLAVLLESTGIDPTIDWTYANEKINLVLYAALHKKPAAVEFWIARGVPAHNREETIDAFDLIGFPMNAVDVVTVQEIFQLLRNKNYVPIHPQTIVRLYPLLQPVQQKDLFENFGDMIGKLEPTQALSLKQMHDMLRTDKCTEKSDEFIVAFNRHFFEKEATTQKSPMDVKSAKSVVLKEGVIDTKRIMQQGQAYIDQKQWSKFAEYLRGELSSYEPNTQLLIQMLMIKNDAPDHEIKAQIESGNIDAKIVEMMVDKQRTTLLKLLADENYLITNVSGQVPDYQGATTEAMLHISRMTKKTD